MQCAQIRKSRLVSAGPDSYEGWADLPRDLISHITDYASPSLLRSVCRSWRTAVDSTTVVFAPAIFRPEEIVARFPSLVHLDLSTCSVTVSNERLQHVRQLPSLQTLNLKGCAKVTAEGLRPLADCKNLQNIILGGELDSLPKAAFQEDKELDNKVI